MIIRTVAIDNRHDMSGIYFGLLYTSVRRHAHSGVLDQPVISSIRTGWCSHWFGSGVFFMLQQFFLTIPRELDEAAISTANPLQFYGTSSFRSAARRCILISSARLPERL